jgi:uncharacterized protein (TIGR02996 family)
MNTETALLQAIHDDPADATSWLALADCLEEGGQQARAELLRGHRAVRTLEGPRKQGYVLRTRELLLAGVTPCWPTLVGALGMPLALIPAGTFWMGSPDTEEERQLNEGPLHEVEVTRPFYLGVYPVTQEEYRRVMRSNPSDFSREGGSRGKVRRLATSRFPVECVTWKNAVAFCERLSARAEERRAGRTYRLPTEAEWEYACRGWLGSDSTWLGEALTTRHANFRGEADLQRPCPVGCYPPNPFGLYDLYGQVWEWCSDWFERDYYSRSPRRDPAGPATGGGRVQRGGCWGAIASCCRTAYRTWDDEAGRQYSFGFRVAMALG